VENMKNQGKLTKKGKINGWMFTLDVKMLKWIPCYSHMEKKLETLEFGKNGLAMLISDVLSWWRNKILLEIFPNLE
jgi:hypothetical protein